MLNWRDPRNPKAGGAERVTLGYLAALAQRGHEVSWFSYAYPGGLPTEQIEGITIIRAGGMWTSALAARRWYRQQAPFDLVIDQHHGIPWYAPWWCGTNCVSYIHEVLGPIWGSFYRWPLSAIGRQQERWTHWLYRRVPFWTACQATKDQLHRHGVQAVTLIPYGVHTQALPALESKPVQEPIRLVAVSRLEPNKRVDHAIRVLPVLKAMNVRAQLTVIGAGGDEPKLRQLAGELELGREITFTGPLDEASKDGHLRQAHLLLHTSVREGWGLNVIEANALGTPGVVYPVPGLVESTLHQRTGLVAECETPEALARCIARLAANQAEYQQYREQAWQRAKTYHWSQVLPTACDWLESQARKR